MESPAEHVYSPSELNREARLHIEMGFPRLLLEGEVSNLSRPTSGHLYFTLKDDRAQIRCALFRSAAGRSSVQLENGRLVLARGRLSLYEPRGDFQLIVDRVQEAGEGALQRRFEELKAKLEAEGLFDPGHKQSLPPYPGRIGLITSPQGAAVRDLLHILGRRWPVARVRLYPVRVQGNEAAAELRGALRAANRHRWADLLIMGRGGGSLEDLVAFNDEAVARAVFESAIPVVSAVGHESDFSICDFVADLRAPTPSAAAELATPDQAVLREAFARSARQLARRVQDRLYLDTQRVDHLTHRLRQRHPAAHLLEQSRQISRHQAALRRAIRGLLERESAKVQSAARRLAAQQPARRLTQLADRVAAARRALDRVARQALSTRRMRLADLVRTLHAVSPLEVIARGYSVLTAAATGTVIGSVRQVGAGDRLEALLKDGRLDCTVDEIHQSE